MTVWNSESRLHYSDMNRIESDMQTIYNLMIGRGYLLPACSFVINRADDGAIDTATTTRLQHGTLVDEQMQYTTVDGGYNNIESNLCHMANAVCIDYSQKDFKNKAISFVDLNRWERTIAKIAVRLYYPFAVCGISVTGDGTYFGGGIFG